MKNLALCVISMVVLLTNQSCNLILGMKKSKQYSPKEIAKLASKRKLNAPVYYVDSTYRQSVSKRKSKDLHIIKNHLQPMQAIYYNKQGYPISYFINCYANPSLFNLKWNEGGLFNTFPPKTLAPLDSLFLKTDLEKELKSVDGQNVSINQNKDYTVFVFWNRNFNRYSKSLIKYIKQSERLSNGTLQVVYVNDDNYLYTLLKK